MNKFSLSYFTCRKESCVKWFIDSLANQVKAIPTEIDLIIVDFLLWGSDADARREEFAKVIDGRFKYIHVPPKPTVWQGPHRLTSKDYFAASNSRNTAICLCKSDWIVFADDLSVLMPTWLAAVNEAINRNHIACGAYRKVFDLVVDNGSVTSFRDSPGGHDSRWSWGNDNQAVACSGGAMYGCSIAAPIEAFLKVNGYPEYADGMGYEDCYCGIAIERNGFKFAYDRRMCTWESEELHGQGTPLLRVDKGVSPNDKSHAMAAMFSTISRFDNYFGEEGIRGLRKRVLAGEPFPIMGIPEHDWYDKQPLKDM